ncbi:NUDIX hydrolase, partial [Streptomyces laculatispora]|nr:NUDIX hydrolase [Streptomyces laculatispora]
AYVYDGGVLDEEQLKAVRVQEDELLSWKLVDRAELGSHLPERLGLRVQAALDVLDSGAGAAELEDGLPVA